MYAFLIQKSIMTLTGLFTIKVKSNFIFTIWIGIQLGAFMKSSEYCTTILNCIWPGLSTWVDYNNPVSMVSFTFFLI